MLTKTICVGGPMDRKLMEFTEAYHEFFYGDKLDGYAVKPLCAQYRIAVHESLTFDEAVATIALNYSNKETKQ